MKWTTPDPATPHLWQGEWLNDAELDKRLASFESELHSILTKPAPLYALLKAAEALSARLRPGPAKDIELEQTLVATLMQDPAMGEAEALAVLETLSQHLARDALSTKLRRELGGTKPQVARRVDEAAEHFEAWAPLGLLVHVAPGNVPSAAPLSVIEGLLAGNLNLLKTSRKGALFAQQLLAVLIRLDESHSLAPYISVVAISSRDIHRLGPIFALADGIAAWGGEAAIEALRELTPPGCRLIDWGHRISFAYLTREKLHDRALLEAVAEDVCRIEQQACSSPQCLYVEVADREALFAFAEGFAQVLAEVSAQMPRAPGAEPQGAEWAEISTTMLLAELEESWADSTRVHVATDDRWRLVAEDHATRRTSPLFRTIWVKPMQPEQIVPSLRPMRRWLQTAGLAAPVERTAELCRLLTQAGVTRIARPGEQLGGYVGSPHDGVYALQRYSRRLSLELGKEFQSFSSFDELTAPVSPLRPGTPILDKAGFMALEPDPAKARLFVRSGGSSGAPKLSSYSWQDYEAQMRAAADGLRAAGLDPSRDRVMNLFFGGHLYGGFISFWSILEALGTTQFPMMGQDDLAEVAQSIVALRANTLVAMPFYISQLFTEQAELLGSYRGVRKVFFGGEHFPKPERDRLQRDFGIEVIRAASYGTNDAGPLGYQCEHCDHSVYHLLSQTQSLEILELEEDRPVTPGQPGRLVFTSLARETMAVERYDIGDMGRAIPEPCPCGRAAPRFELLGRHGDMFRAPSFFSYSKFVRILAEEGGYSGPVQLVLRREGNTHEIEVLVLEDQAADCKRLHQLLIEHDHELLMRIQENLSRLKISPVPLDAFATAPTTGKLKSIIDLRPSA
jgi:phenylacetate-coenzyme A ligase PaaK-like adenylate-forming protein